MSKKGVKSLKPSNSFEIEQLKATINYVLSILEVQRVVNSFSLEQLKDKAETVEETENTKLVVAIFEDLSLVNDNGALKLCKFIKKAKEEADGATTSEPTNAVRETIQKVPLT